ncbi:MAG: imidazoleglycerol-phosphate dehydratase HisB [Clostridia bacterium]|nr:imidazoleglycerol-phosphate dehydratase HisB [Clostridia bacterium]
MRNATIIRKTNETDINLTLSLDKGERKIDTGCGFLDHMLDLFAKHGNFGLEVSCKGDTHVDFHHTVEDVGIALGEAFSKALGNKKGIVRYGSMILPMDEALILSAIDLSGRAHLSFSLNIPAKRLGTFDTELVKEFFLGFVRSAACTLHIQQLAGKNSHHIIEGAFKSVGRSMKQACAIDSENPDSIPSTKGVL